MKSKIWIGMLCIYIIWGSTYLAIRFTLQGLPPFVSAAARFLIAGLIMITWRLLAGDRLPNFRQVRSAGIVGLFLLVGGNGLVFWAEQTVPSGITAVMIGSVPLWIVLLDSLRPGGIRPRLMTIIGIIVGFIGIILLVNPVEWLQGIGGFDVYGISVLVLATFFWSIGSLYNRDADMPEAPLMASSVEMLVGGMGLLLLATLTGEWAALKVAQITPNSLFGLAYLIVFGSLVAFTAYTWLLRVAPTSLVATYAYVNPVVAIFLGYLFLQEPITLRTLAATGIIIAAVAVINASRSRSQQIESVDKPASVVLGKDRLA